MKSIMEEASSIVKAIEAAWIRAEKPHEFSVKVFEEPEKNFFGMVTKSAKIALIFKNVEKKQSYKEQSSPSKPKFTAHPSEPTFTSSHPKEYARKESSRHESAMREPRESREPREYREQREPVAREPRETREPRENREPRERREPMVREPRESRELREPREQRERREPMVREIVRREPTPRPAAPIREQEITATPKDHAFEGANQEVKERIFWTEEMIEITRVWIDTLLKNLKCDDITFTLEPKRYYLTISFSRPVRDTKALEQQLFRSCAYLIMQMLRTKLKKQFRGLKVVLHSPA